MATSTAAPDIRPHLLARATRRTAPQSTSQGATMARAPAASATPDSSHMSIDSLAQRINGSSARPPRGTAKVPGSRSHAAEHLTARSTTACESLQPSPSSAGSPLSGDILLRHGRARCGWEARHELHQGEPMAFAMGDDGRTEVQTRKCVCARDRPGWWDRADSKGERANTGAALVFRPERFILERNVRRFERNERAS